MNADLNIPLSDEELDELDKFLMSGATNDESMDISMLDYKRFERGELIIEPAVV